MQHSLHHFSVQLHAIYFVISFYLYLLIRSFFVGIFALNICYPLVGVTYKYHHWGRNEGTSYCICISARFVVRAQRFKIMVLDHKSDVYDSRTVHSWTQTQAFNAYTQHNHHQLARWHWQSELLMSMTWLQTGTSCRFSPQQVGRREHSSTGIDGACESVWIRCEKQNKTKKKLWFLCFIGLIFQWIICYSAL